MYDRDYTIVRLIQGAHCRKKEGVEIDNARGISQFS